MLEFILKMEDELISDIHIRESQFLYCRKAKAMERTDIFVSRKDIEEFIVNVLKKEIPQSRETPSEMDFSVKIGRYRYRCNLFSSRGKTGIVLRRISDVIPSVESLGLPQEVLRLCSFKSGIVIIAGPTGSGKSSTLASIVEFINENQKKHIITIEDPIEYEHESKCSLVTQREIGLDSCSFRDAVKFSLRQDPDIIIIGEARDEESLKMAVRAANSGHLCFCTLHTLGAVATIDRILEMFGGDEKDSMRYTLSQEMKAVMSQQLILKKTGGQGGKTEVSPVIDLMFVDKSISNMIRDGKVNQIENHMISNRRKGNISMDMSLVNLYRNGSITMSQLRKYAIDKDSVPNKLRSRGFGL